MIEPRVPCPICAKPAVAAFRPFCSLRCAEVDLGRWFRESYRVPADGANPANDDDDLEPPE